MKSINPSPDFGTPCSGQSVNWNWRTVRDWPSWIWADAFDYLRCTEDFVLNFKGCRQGCRWLTLASVTLNSRRMYWGMLYSAIGSTTKYWYLAERSAGQYWWHFSCTKHKKLLFKYPENWQLLYFMSMIFGPKVNKTSRLYIRWILILLFG